MATESDFENYVDDAPSVYGSDDEIPSMEDIQEDFQFYTLKEAEELKGDMMIARDVQYRYFNTYKEDMEGLDEENAEIWKKYSGKQKFTRITYQQVPQLLEQAKRNIYEVMLENVESKFYLDFDTKEAMKKCGPDVKQSYMDQVK